MGQEEYGGISNGMTRKEFTNLLTKSIPPDKEIAFFLLNADGFPIVSMSLKDAEVVSDCAAPEGFGVVAFTAKCAVDYEYCEDQKRKEKKCQNT